MLATLSSHKKVIDSFSEETSSERKLEEQQELEMRTVGKTLLDKKKIYSPSENGM